MNPDPNELVRASLHAGRGLSRRHRSPGGVMRRPPALSRSPRLGPRLHPVERAPRRGTLYSPRAPRARAPCRSLPPRGGPAAGHERDRPCPGRRPVHGADLPGRADHARPCGLGRQHQLGRHRPALRAAHDARRRACRPSGPGRALGAARWRSTDRVHPPRRPHLLRRNATDRGRCRPELAPAARSGASWPIRHLPVRRGGRPRLCPGRDQRPVQRGIEGRRADPGGPIYPTVSGLPLGDGVGQPGGGTTCRRP